MKGWGESDVTITASHQSAGSKAAVGECSKALSGLPALCSPIERGEVSAAR